MSIEITRVEDPTDADWQTVLKPLEAHNRERVGPHVTQRMVFILRDADGVGVGGLCGHAYWGWLHVDLLFVPAAARGKGVGSELLARAESFALEKRYVGVWLDTFTFQAPEFYRRRGYEAFGTLERYPNDESRIFFRKRLEGAPLPRQLQVAARDEQAATLT
jgi:GNAT superfamily N-acetyltransferase